MNNIIQTLNLDPALSERLCALFCNNAARIDALAARFPEDVSCLEGENDLMRLAVVARCLEQTRRYYERLGISKQIFQDTVSDVAIWCANNGNRGLKNYRWLRNHVRGNIFRLGRLQFQLYRCPDGFDYARLPFDSGEPVVYIHIPQGRKLLREDCLASIAFAKDFFARYFPDYVFRYFFCESWLLYDGNRDFMRPDSNILQFASLFDLAYSEPDDAQAIERIFGTRMDDPAAYPENTSLQRAAKQYLLAGHSLGVGIGTRALN